MGEDDESIRPCRGADGSLLMVGLKGPADFATFGHAGGYIVFVPDLVQSEVRVIRLGR